MLLSVLGTTGQPEPQEAEVCKRISAAASVSLAQMAENTDYSYPGAEEGGARQTSCVFAGLKMGPLGNGGPRLEEQDSPSDSSCVCFSL